MTRSLQLATALAVCASLLPVSAPVRADVIERVVARVNDDAVFLSELRRRATPFLPQVMDAPSEAERIARLGQLYNQLLEALIEEVLLRQTATRMRVRVNNQDVERALQNVQRQNNLSAEEFWAAVRNQGFSEAQYRLDLRRQLLRLKVINTRVRARVNITEETVRAEYEERRRRANRRLRFHASHVFMTAPPNANATQIATLREDAIAVQSALTVDNFEDAVDTHGGGDLGWLGETDLPAELVAALQDLDPDEISEPIRGPQGFHIFLLHERERGGDGLPPFDQVKNEIYREMMERQMGRQERLFLQELRRDAIIERRL